MAEGRGRPRTLLIVLAVIGGLALVGCLGFVGLVFLGKSLFMDQAMATLNRNPVILQHVGEISEMEINWTRSGLEEDLNVCVYDVKGVKGTGIVTAEFIAIDADTEALASGELELSSGETYDLFPKEEVSAGKEDGD